MVSAVMYSLHRPRMTSASAARDLSGSARESKANNHHHRRSFRLSARSAGPLRAIITRRPTAEAADAGITRQLLNLRSFRSAPSLLPPRCAIGGRQHSVLSLIQTIVTDRQTDVTYLRTPRME